jgi:hypothetical protein
VPLKEQPGMKALAAVDLVAAEAEQRADADVWGL